MILHRFKILIPLILILPCLPVFSQEFENWIAGQNPVTVDKVYLHTDREFYFRKETIWFKAYLLDSFTQLLKQGNENLFVELIGEKGKVALNCNLITNNGEAPGYFQLNDSIPPGNYKLRAHTEYLKNFGEEAFFHKNIRISEVMNSFEIDRENNKSTRKENRMPDVSFLPEGGFLLANNSNQVAVKAIDSSGKAVYVRGLVTKENGDSVAFFETGYKGMGSFYFFPEENTEYRIQLEGYPEFTGSIRDIRKDDLKIQLSYQNKEEVVISVASGSEKFNDREFYLADMYQGVVQFYKKFVPGTRSCLFRLSKTMFPGGINRLILLDEKLQPVSERMIFSDNIDCNHLNINVDSASYKTRSEINLHITDRDSLTEGEFSKLSVAVVDENSVNAGGVSQNILSWLLLDSELKGHIESPADFFETDSITSEQKIDLLMLTHGWANYFWNSISAKTDTTVHPHTSGINLKGHVKKYIGTKPVGNGSLSLLIFRNGDIEFLGGKTNEKGVFNFGEVFFYDTASVFLQARNEKGSRFTEVFLDSVFTDRPEITSHFLNDLKYYSDVPLEFYRRKYLNELSLREFSPDKSSILLNEIEIRKEKKEKDDGHFRMYGMADNSLKVTGNDISYRDVFSFLAGRVAGVVVSGNSVSIRGMGTPLFLVDGIPYEGEDGVSMIESIPMSDIDVVEVLKNASNLALFGSRGANGVIAVYTKRGFIDYTPKDYLIGAISRKIVGYQPFREFYSPKYTPDNVNNQEPDYRSTLYWNPGITTEKGKADLSFFSCDDVTNYRIFVEGITRNGRICIGTGRFSVDRFNADNK